VTFRGKVIDADTLKPIEGAVVVAEWDKCWPGIGAGELCSFKMVKEGQTDANGEWSITGPKGTRFPSKTRVILGFIVSWTAPPRIQIYKPGYCRDVQKPGWIQAYPYVNKEKKLEGIVLIRMGDTREEEKEFMKRYLDDYSVPFIPVKDPEKKLRELDFNFRYPPDAMRIGDVWDNTIYNVIGLKKAVTQEEKRKAEIGYVEHMSQLPLLRKLIEDERSQRKPLIKGLDEGSLRGN
jgi:hypothetical protein